MIEPMMATMLASSRPTRGRAGAAAARADGGRPTTRSTRSPWTASARPTTACSRSPTARAASRSTRRLTALSSRRSARVCEPLAIGIVRGGEGATKLITVAVTGARDRRRRAAGGAGDRELAAREDGRPRRRSELGPARRRRRARRASAFELERARVQIGDVELFAGRPAARRARAAGGRVPARARTSTIEVDLGTGGPGTPRDVDVRPERRVRADQRGVPDMSMPSPRRQLAEAELARPTRSVAPLTQFLSVLDLTPARARDVSRRSRRAEGGARAPGAARARRSTGRARRAAVREAVAAHAVDVPDCGARARRRRHRAAGGRRARRPRDDRRRRAQPRALGRRASWSARSRRRGSRRSPRRRRGCAWSTR